MVAGWLLVQGASIVFPTFGAPAWALKLFVAAAFALFPFVIWIAWVASPTPNIRHLHAAGKWTRGDFVLLSLVATVLLISLLQLFISSGIRPSTLPQARVSAPQSESSIAVLPFENLSSDKDTGYFADGIQDEILTRLAQIRALKVISRTSTEQFASRPGNLRDIARELGVATILEGSVQKSGNKVRVNVQLIRAASDDHIWAQIYDRDMTDVFSVESDVAAAIANALAAKITPPERARLAAKSTTNPQAYDDYLRGLAAYRRNDDLSLQKSIQYLQQAVKADPKYVQAWALLSRVNAYFYFGHAASQAGSDALAALSRARALNPNSTDAQLAQGFYLYYVDRDYQAALRQFQLVNSIAPNNAEVLSALGVISRRINQWRQSRDYFKQAIALDPLEEDRRAALIVQLMRMRDYDGVLNQADIDQKRWPGKQKFVVSYLYAYLAMGDLQKAGSVAATLKPDAYGFVAENTRYYWLARRFRDGIANIRKGIAGAKAEKVQNSDLADLFLQLGQFQNAAGETKAAQASFAQAIVLCAGPLKATPDDPNVLSTEALAQAGLGQRQAAEDAADRAIALVPISKDSLDGPSYAEIRLRVALHFNDKERAIPIIARLLSIPCYFSSGILRHDPDFDPLRSDPRFRTLENQPDVVLK